MQLDLKVRYFTSEFPGSRKGETAALLLFQGEVRCGPAHDSLHRLKIAVIETRIARQQNVREDRNSQKL